MCSDYEARVINRWISVNVLFIFWLIITVAVALQQCESSEPLAAGFFWGTIGAFVLGSIVNHEMGIANPLGLMINIVIQLLGLAIQILLAVLYWDELKAIDAALRNVRAGISLIIPGTDHRFIGRMIWLLLTAWGIRRAFKRGFLFYSVRGNP